MTLNLSVPGHEELKPRITVFGVGGAGGNAVDNMIENQLDGVEFVVANTDAQALRQSTAPVKVQIGAKVTEGLGAGAKPTVGASAAEESIEQIVDNLAGSHMCFITAGMGGGTGTGAAPIIAQAARELGVLTVGVVTKPFQFEGSQRMKQAEAGVEALQKVVDTLIIIPNQNLFRIATEKTTATDAFALADDVLYQGVKGVTDLMVRPGIINLDFADVRAVMDEMGKAMMGTGEASGEDRAIQAAEKAIANPLLDEISLNGAKGVLINVTGGHDLTLFELDEAANRIREEVDPEANIIVGSTLDDGMEGVMRVSVVATGIDAAAVHADVPQPRRASSAYASVAAANVVAPAAAKPAPAPVAEAEERNLFEDLVEEPASQEPEMPAPAYQPAVQQPAAVAAPAAQPEDFDPMGFHAAAPEEFVAPRAPAPGTPSPAALERLQRAAAKAVPAAPQQAAVPAPEPEADDKPRFAGINTLIGRMTGAAEAATQQRPAPAPQQPMQHANPSPQPVAQNDSHVDDDRVEIPAFLRRQAN